MHSDAAGNGLTRIAGIEPHVAARLREAGIHTVDDLARSTPEQVLAACGRDAAANTRAQRWIEQAAELTARAAAAEREAPSEARLLPRRTFTVEVWVDSDAARVVSTRAVHLETQDADAWSGWSRSRLLNFMETRTGVVMPAHSPATGAPAAQEHGTADAQPAVPTAAGVPHATTDAADTRPLPPALVVHRFGLLNATIPAMRRGEMAARLRLDPADLGLPAGLTAFAQVELMARPLGAGRAKILDTHVIDLAGHVLDAVLPVRLPDGADPPFAVLAAVKVLVDQPTRPPAEGLGNATLDLTPDGAAA